jgi:hypothetical protein
MKEYYHLFVDKEIPLQGNQGFGTLSVRRKKPMSSKGCWMPRRKVDRATELEAMVAIRERFPLGYISYVCQVLQFGRCM